MLVNDEFPCNDRDPAANDDPFNDACDIIEQGVEMHSAKDGTHPLITA